MVSSPAGFKAELEWELEVQGSPGRLAKNDDPKQR
jgi:hypothetical protein